MPTYEVTAPDGKTYQIDGPPNAAQRDIVNALLSKYPEAATPFKPDTGLVSAFTSSARAGLGSAAEGAGEFAGLPGLAEFGKQQQAAAARSFAPTTQEDVAAADKRGLIAGATTRASRFLEPIVQDVGNIVGRFGGPLAVGTVAEAALPVELATAPFLGGVLEATGLGTIGKAVSIGAVGVSDIPLEAGQRKVAREKLGLPPDPVADLVGGIASAAWLALSPGLLSVPLKAPMASLLGKSAVQQAERLAPKVLAGELTAAEASTQVSGYLTNALKGTIENAAVGSGMMVGSTAIERATLGQDLTSPEALGQYGEAIKGAVGLSPVFGLAHGIGAKGEAVARLKENEAERTAALADISTQKAEQAQTLRERDLAQAELEKQKPEYAERIMDQYRAAEQEKLDLINQKRSVESGSVTETADRLHNKAIDDQVKALQPNIESLAAEYNKYYKPPQADEAAETPAAAPGMSLADQEPTGPTAMEPVDTTGLDKTSDYVTSLTNDLNLTTQQRDAVKGTNLLSMVGKLRLNQSDWADIGSLPTFARGKGGEGTSISDRIADGAFDRWLPFNLRSEVIEGNLDRQLEAEEYIKEAFRQHGLGKPFYDYETRIALAENEAKISEIEKEIDRENNLEEVNGEIQNIADELAAEERGNREPSEFGVEPEGATRGAAEGEREDATAKLTSPEEEQLSSTEPTAPEPEAPLKPIDTSKLQAVLTKALLPTLQKFGLKDVGLKLIEDAGNYEGQYTQKLISIALDASKPLQALRHEVIHALKDMGFFTKGQWALLEKQADRVWIDKYLKERNVDGRPIKEGEESRFDAYMKLYKGDMDAIREEAIADAFADFDAHGAPKGIMSTLLEKMRNFFAKVKDALTGNGYTTAEDVFKQIESGGLKATRESGAAAKPSLRSSSYGLNVLNDIETAPDFGKKPLVDDVAKHFDEQVMKKFGRKLDYSKPEDMAAAIKMATEEVAHQMKSEKSGLDWYDDDIKKAFTDTAKVIPSLNSEPKRQLFSIMAGILSPQINARDNWFIAAKAFEHYEKTGVVPGVNPETGGLWQGGQQSANKKKAMDFLNNMIKAMGEKGALDWLQSNHTVKEINDFRKNYGGMSSGIDGKASDIRPGLYAFGPKVGPFVSNINGIHDVTVDKWATRTFNRYFGTMTDSDGKVIDAPTEPQRRAVKALMNEVASNADIKNYQVQSLLWFYEQKLFRKFGTDSPSYGFSQGAEKLLSQRGVRGGDEGVGAAEAAQAKPSLRAAPDTPEFKRWFGDSKVVDTNGNPLVMYHATSNFKGNEFKPSPKVNRTGNPDGYYFTYDIRDANNYAGEKEGSQIIPVYLSIKDPYFYGKSFHSSKMVAAFEKELRKDNPRLGDDWIEEKVDTFKNGRFPNISFPTDAMTRVIQAGGYDGMKDGRDFVAFNSSQIKSAIGNRGTYDPTNPDIRASLRTAPDWVPQNIWDLHEKVNRAEDLASGRIASDLRPQDLKREQTMSFRRLNKAVEDYVGKDFNKVNALMVRMNEETGRREREQESREPARYSFRTAPNTPEFKQFFGDSKIVDAKGEPKVMYHGTARDITTFKPKQAGAIFLTDDPDFANVFSKDSLAWMSAHPDQFLTQKQIDEGKARAIAAIRKDYGTRPEGKTMIDSIKAGNYDDATAEGQEYLRKAYKEMMPSGPNIVPAYVRAEKPFDYANPEHMKVIEDYEKANRYTDRSISNYVNDVARGNWEAIENRKIQKAIKQAGFDGFYVLEGGRKNLAVYDPAQIKSATGNIGTYGQRPVSEADAERFGMTQEQAQAAQDAGDMRFSLRKIQSRIQNMPDGANILDAINKRSPAREEKGFIERLLTPLGPEPFSYIRQKFIYQYNQLGVYGKRVAAQMGGIEQLADQSAEAAALESDRASGITASALGVGNRTGGIPVYRNGYTTISNEGGTINGLVDIFHPIAVLADGDPTIWQTYQFWAMAKRGERLTEKGLEKYTQKELDYAKQIGKEFPEFEEAQKKWIKYNDGLVKYQIDTGIINEEMGKEWMRYADYIPFYRQLDGERTVGPKMYQNLTGVKPPKKFLGVDENGPVVADFWETMIRNTQAAITAGLKNVAGQKAIDEAVFLGTAAKIENPKPAPNIVSIMRNGEVEHYDCSDRLFVDAVRSLSLPELPGLSFLSKPADVLRSMVTKDPRFIIANMMKHSMYTYATSGADINPVTGTIKHFTEALRNKSPEYQKLLDAGVIGGYEFSSGSDTSRKAVLNDLSAKSGTESNLRKTFKPITGIWQYLEHASEAHDAAVRISVYKDVLAKTGNEAEALFRANEVLNFNRKGNSALVRVITAGIPFLNAKVQGLDLMYRGLVQPSLGGDVSARQRQVQKTALIRAGTMVGLSVMYAALVTNDPDYEAQQQEVKDNNWIIPGLGVRIPIPFEIGTMFKTIPEHIYRYFYGKENLKELQAAGKKALGDAIAISPVFQVALPLYEAKSNYSYFTGRPIVGTHMQGIDPKFQVEPNTSIISKELGQITGISPLLIDHVYQGYTGTMGMYFSDLMDAAFGMAGSTSKPSLRLEQMPVIKGFLIDNQATGQVSQFYELKDSVETAVRTINDLKSRGSPELTSYAQEHAKEYAVRGSVEQIAKQLQALKKQALAIRDMDISRDEKRDRLLENVKAQNATVASIGRIKEYLNQ